MANVDDIVKERIGILKEYEFFRYFMDSDLPDNKLFIDNLRRGGFAQELRNRGFSKKEIRLLEHLVHLSTFPPKVRYNKLQLWLTSELTSEFITFELVKNPFGRNLKQFYSTIYQEVFPEEEQEDMSSFILYISKESLASGIINAFLKNECGDKINIRYYLLIVKIKGVIVGAAIFYTLNTKRISFVILEYIVVVLDHLRDIEELKEFASGAWRIRISTGLLNKCKYYAIKDAIKYGPGTLSFIMAEVNDPVKMYRQGILQEDIANPAARVRLYSQIGFRFLDFHWIQPSLGEGKEAIDYLYLIMMPFTPEWQNQIDPARFKYAFLTYLATWKGVDLKKDPTVLKMRNEIESRINRKIPIRLMNYFDLKISKEVVRACMSIDWKLKEAVKN